MVPTSILWYGLVHMDKKQAKVRIPWSGPAGSEVGAGHALWPSGGLVSRGRTRVRTTHCAGLRTRLPCGGPAAGHAWLGLMRMHGRVRPSRDTPLWPRPGVPGTGSCRRPSMQGLQGGRHILLPACTWVRPGMRPAAPQGARTAAAAASVGFPVRCSVVAETAATALHRQGIRQWAARPPGEVRWRGSRGPWDCVPVPSWPGRQAAATAGCWPLASGPRRPA